MLKAIDIIIGSGFGAEGKGLVTDWRCSTGGKVLNIRANGGSQAGHTVVTDNERVVFHNIGAGSLNSGVDTCLSEYFYLNPLEVLREVGSLTDFNRIIYVNKNTPLVFYADGFINRMNEQDRKDKAHGSCGQGIYEAIRRGRAGFEFTAYDWVQGKQHFFEKYRACAKEYWSEFDAYHMPTDPITDWNIIDKFFSANYVKMYTDIGILANDYDKVVIEMAQGLLLDMNNMSYYPHLTPTQTGSDNPIRIVNDIRKFKSKVPVNVYYTMRTYMTRHGDGPMRHEVKSSSELSENIKEFTNVTNKFQGEFRYGRISPKEIRTALKFDMNKWDGMRNIHHNLVITHADETDGKVLMHNGTYSCVGAAKCVGFNKNSLYVSYGPMNRDIKKYSDK